jgi:hypothetical protein
MLQKTSPSPIRPADFARQRISYLINAGTSVLCVAEHFEDDSDANLSVRVDSIVIAFQESIDDKVALDGQILVIICIFHPVRA